MEEKKKKHSFGLDTWTENWFRVQVVYLNIEYIWVDGQISLSFDVWKFIYYTPYLSYA